MFTGIIQNLGKVTGVEAVENALKLRVATGFSDLVLGESVAIQGVCLTVAAAPDTSGTESEFFLSPETLARTTLGNLKPGSSLNLERALRAGDRMSGHWVQGHVDGLADLVSTGELGGGSYQLVFRLPENLLPYLVEKGSISLNGVSLTVNSLRAPDLFEVALIPHTWDATDLHTLKPGDRVNVEVDILAKYVERQTAFQSRATGNA